ncbi:putative Late embryogenesis abundant protein, LEA5-type [Medicago truncatula]|uniref:Putative Late embryogenesis abundant protein, LEA5-type n=1 Tax=Medicago truncatula TaxID=3880 RepID=G7K0X8_MEDTR|nr:uncharacterized protein LOC11439590 [Medicago truncatula]AES93586.1 hypothetical protein MTR_5g005180 [Medicago truncatula]RHN53230.1 putative Late embryogenesis abundant protein, LEA5-type [Medicago truncatula]
MGRSNMFIHLRRTAKGAENTTGICRYLGREVGSKQLLVDQKTKSGSLGKKAVVDSTSSYSSCWVPHPRTGIYFPVGHEWVMEDVPDGAATFSETCYFRN